MSKKIPAVELIKSLLKKDITPEEIKAIVEQAIVAITAFDTELTNALGEVSTLGENLSTLQKEFDLVSEQKGELSQKLSLANERFDELTGEIEQLTSSKELLQDDLDDALREVSRLGAQLDAQQDLEDGQFLVDIEGESHILIGNRFSFKGVGEMDAKTLSKNKDLLAEMKAKGSGALIPANK